MSSTQQSAQPDVRAADGTPLQNEHPINTAATAVGAIDWTKWGPRLANLWKTLAPILLPLLVTTITPAATETNAS